MVVVTGVKRYYRHLVAKAEVAAKYPAMDRTAPTAKNSPARNVNSIVGKPWFDIYYVLSALQHLSREKYYNYYLSNMLRS